jgi:four helix bundle protein
MQDFKNLNVWQMARQLTKSIYTLTMDFPGSEEFGLKSQMRRASVSICTNIAEGCGRRGDREFRRFVDVAMGSACELECETILSFDLAFITEAMQEQILEKLIQIKRMLGSLANKLLSSIEKQRKLCRSNKEAARSTARIQATQSRADRVKAPGADSR